ncbi:MAG: hypothetical protein JW857_09750 [Bacteroidales bacterium]|nr:hypothetical protein [Bacteroidales bacterium]
MQHSIRIFLLLLSLTLSISVLAQQKLTGGVRGTAANSDSEGDLSGENTKQNDSLLNVGNPKNVKIYSFYSKYIGYKQMATVDTTLHNIEFYNPAKQTQTFSQDLGIIGSASTPLILQFDPQVTFDLGIHVFDLYIRHIQDVEIIETPTPFTQLSYVMGAKKENVLRVQHAQSFLDKQIKAGIDFKLFNAIGYYTRQKTDVKNFSANLSYKTKDNRYSIEGVYFHNKLILRENGGIVYDSLYEQNIQQNRQLFSVQLAQAENDVKYSGIGIQQNFYIARAEPDYSAIPDTNVLDLEGYKVYHYKKPYFDPITPLGRVSHTFLYSREIYNYIDSDGSSAFYKGIPSFPMDLTETSDSISHQRIENTFLYSNSNYKDNIENPKFLKFSFGAGLISNRYSQDSFKYAVRTSTLTEIAPQAKLQLFITSRYSLMASGVYSYRSDNTSAYALNGNLNLQIGKNTIDLAVQSKSTQPYWIYEHYYGDYFQWENSFKNQKFQEISFLYSLKQTQIKAKTGLIHDYLFFDQNISPQQYSSALSYINVSLFQKIRLGHFGLDLNLIYQGVSDNTILRVPKFYSNTQVFYTNTLFKNVLDMEIGFNIRYFSNYYANAYMPALRTFYFQNEKEYGNYPYIDIYVNAKIKRARIFFKYEQLNSGFMPQYYFASPHYPNPDANIKFGVIWQLFN